MFITKAIVLAASAVLCFARPDFQRTGIQQMEIVAEEDMDFVATNSKSGPTYYDHELFRFMRTNYKSMPALTDSLFSTFKWQDCGNSTAELLHINGLAVTPDPLRLPGNINLKFDVDIKKSVDAPLKLKLEVQKHEGPIWITIPCIGGIGSCTYDDLCDTLRGAVCPQPFDDHHIPCKCPFGQGHYSLPTSPFPLDVGEIPSGSYYAKAELSYSSQPVTCVELYFAIA